MANSVTVKLEGLDKLLRKIDRAREDVRRAIMREVAKSALNIQYGAKARCPVGKTGRLKASILVHFGDLEAKIGPHMPYAPYVEYGTRKMHARPYLGPAFEEERPKFYANLEKALRRVVGK